MNIITSLPRTEAEVALRALQQYMAAHAEALVSAAALLGGRPAVRRTASLLEDILSADRLTRRLRHELAGLHRLLSLQCVQDVESLEAACFAEIDPASPVVEQVCLLSDELLAHLEALARAEECEVLSRLADAA